MSSGSYTARDVASCGCLYVADVVLVEDLLRGMNSVIAVVCIHCGRRFSSLDTTPDACIQSDHGTVWSTPQQQPETNSDASLKGTQEIHVNRVLRPPSY